MQRAKAKTHRWWLRKEAAKAERRAARRPTVRLGGFDFGLIGVDADGNEVECVSLHDGLKELYSPQAMAKLLYEEAEAQP